MLSQFCLLMYAVTLSGQGLAKSEVVELVPRTVLAFYDSELDGEVATTEAHVAAEMPLNHLGLVVRYHDIHKQLPDKKAMADVRGILLWFYWDSMPSPNAKPLYCSGS